MAAKTPEDCDALFEKYLNEGNLDALVELYEPDATLLGPSGEAKGHDAIRAQLGGLIAAKGNLKLKVTKTVICGDVAVTYNEWSGTMSPGGQPVQLSGKAMEICHRQPDGTWRFAIDDPNARG